MLQLCYMNRKKSFSIFLCTIFFVPLWSFRPYFPYHERYVAGQAASNQVYPMRQPYFHRAAVRLLPDAYVLHNHSSPEHMELVRRLLARSSVLHDENQDAVIDLVMRANPD